MKYRLISIQKTPVTLLMFPKTVNGRVSYSHYMKLDPDIEYVTDDEAQKNYIRTHKEKVRYNSALEEGLKAIGADYKVVFCKSCGGKIKKIEYSILEVLDDE